MFNLVTMKLLPVKATPSTFSMEGKGQEAYDELENWANLLSFELIWFRSGTEMLAH